MCTELPQTHSEHVTMTLLSELEPTISTALNSLGEGHMTQRIEDLYYFYAAKHIHDAVDTFIVLRGQHRVDGARLVVRPALETMLRLRAVRAKPYLLYRVLIAENNELDKWFSGVARRHNLPYTPISQRPEWQAVKARCVSQFGAEKLNNETPLTAYDAAAAIGIEAYYDSHYRGFSHYTHGLLEAVSGNLDELIDPEASRVMLQSAMTSLEILADLGASCPGLTSFTERVTAVMKSKPDKLIRRKPA
jgi:Family of unknown function (DUF5677)